MFTWQLAPQAAQAKLSDRDRASAPQPRSFILSFILYIFILNSSALVMVPALMVVVCRDAAAIRILYQFLIGFADWESPATEKRVQASL